MEKNTFTVTRNTNSFTLSPINAVFAVNKLSNRDGHFMGRVNFQYSFDTYKEARDKFMSIVTSTWAGSDEFDFNRNVEFINGMEM